MIAVIAIVMSIVYFVIFQSLNNSYKLLTNEWEKEVLCMQVEAMKNRMEAIRQSTEQAAVYRHDLRHHANLLTGMLHDGRSEDALSYVQKLGTFSFDKGCKIYCENTVVNTILTHYLELCTALSNLLENAVEHCDGTPPNLAVSIVQNKEQFCLCIQNSFDGIAGKDESGDYHSAKPQGGIGLRSVAAIVTKYKGAMNVSHTETTFTVDIAMKPIA